MDTAVQQQKHSSSGADLIVNSRPKGATAREAADARAIDSAELRFHAVPVPDHLLERVTLSRVLYRILEWPAAVVILVLALPVLLIEAILIKLDSPGPALFWQPRVARSVIRRGRDLMSRDDLIPPDGGFAPDSYYLVPVILKFVKFRTMYADSRERFPELYRFRFSDHDEFLASYYKVADDPRVTRIGRFFRRTTLDELPNLFLVLTGRMRLVGPRPEGLWMMPFYSREQMAKFAVTPGVTGLAQARGRGDLLVGEQIAFDLEYVQHRSVWLDVKILWWTFLGVFRRTGAF
jgi:lipopolysaccharide/colanic/teichoic acid biosynthesis glycosyltransferase